MKTKIILIASVVALAGLAGVAVAAAYPRPMIVNINPNGEVLLRGTVNSVGANSMNVKSWAGSWTINTSANTTITPSINLSQISVGDFVGVQGHIDSNSTLTVNASLIRDWSFVQNNSQPSINGISGPSHLYVGQSGTWTIDTQDHGNNLSYSVNWGDQLLYPMNSDKAGAPTPMPIFLQTTTFSHTYNQAGTYTITFTVRNSAGQTTSSTMTVAVQ
jgi:hypothetical protein